MGSGRRSRIQVEEKKDFQELQEREEQNVLARDREEWVQGDQVREQGDRWQKNKNTHTQKIKQLRVEK